MPETRFAALAFTLALVAPHAAHACGGCFHGPAETEQVVTDHRMVMAIQADQAVLWDQIRYSGTPSDFAWVLPVFGDVRVELASNDFFDQLDQATAMRVQSPPVPGAGCGGGGLACGAGAAPSASGVDSRSDPGVTVVHEATIGPYETVTLRSSSGMALSDWLTTNGYAIPAAIQPTVQFYVDRHMDFVALRLRPDVGVEAMQPVRIVYPTANMVLPLRMVAAGVGDKVGISLWVFGEGRYEAANFGNGEVAASQVVWNWDTNHSNYADVFEQTLTLLGGRAWITEYAEPVASLSNVQGGGDDWSLAVGANNVAAVWVTRLRTDLLARYLDADLQLQAASNGAPVNNVLVAGQQTGTPPGTRCSAVVTIATPDDVVHRPAGTLAALAASAIALVVGWRSRRRR